MACWRRRASSCVLRHVDGFEDTTTNHAQQLQPCLEYVPPAGPRRGSCGGGRVQPLNVAVRQQVLLDVDSVGVACNSRRCWGTSVVNGGWRRMRESEGLTNKDRRFLVC
jgi:hypothetical protein